MTFKEEPFIRGQHIRKKVVKSELPWKVSSIEYGDIEVINLLDDSSSNDDTSEGERVMQ